MVAVLHENQGYHLGDLVPEKMQQTIAAIRAHLRMDIAFITDFVDEHNIVRFVEGDSEHAISLPGACIPGHESYCHLFAGGVLPSIIRDTSLDPVARKLTLTHKLNIVSYIAAPLRDADGATYGVFSCIGHKDGGHLSESDLAVMSMFADMAGTEIREQIKKRQNYLNAQRRILEVMKPEKLNISYQPIYDLQQKKVVGYESLARFDTQPYQTPDIWFNQAKLVGLDQQLELLAIKQGLESIHLIDESAYLSLNVSAEIILSGILTNIFSDEIAHRIVLEVTEHAKVPDYQLFREALSPLRKKGVRVAVDDAGAGYASFQHVLELRAEIIKLDISLIKGLDKDPARSALASALIAFARETNTKVIAEGVETQEEYLELLRIGVDSIQGYYVGYPMPVEQVILYTPTVDAHRT